MIFFVELVIIIATIELVFLVVLMANLWRFEGYFFDQYQTNKPLLMVTLYAVPFFLSGTSVDLFNYYYKYTLHTTTCVF